MITSFEITDIHHRWHHQPNVGQWNCQHIPLKTLHYQQHIHHLNFSSHRTFKQKKVQFPEQQVQVTPSYFATTRKSDTIVNTRVRFHFSIYYPHSKLRT